MELADLSCDVLVIGGGPGGYVCAIRAGQLGLKTVLAEEKALGGTCLNVGCIPSKALIHVADEFHHMVEANAKGGTETGLSCKSPAVDLAKTKSWKDGIVSRLTGGVGGLLKRSGVTVLNGRATVLDGKTAEVALEDGVQRVNARHVVLANGSKPVSLPNLPIGGKIIGSTEALDLEEVPKNLVVVGAGYIGLEMGTAFAKLGSKVHVVEAGDRILPLYDEKLVAPVKARLKELGIEVLTGTKVESVNKKDRAVLDKGDPLPFDALLVTVGRQPNLENSGVEDLGLDMSGPFIKISDQCETSMRGVYAIGDITGEPLLAHRAMAQGEMVAELIAGNKRSWDDRCVPAVCFTDPEIVSAGLSPEEAKSKGIETVVGQFPFIANGRALSLQREDGFVRVVARKSDHAIIGVQAVGANISEMSSAFSTAIEMGARLEDVASIIEAHPTQSEGFQEAAMKALGHAIHF